MDAIAAVIGTVWIVLGLIVAALAVPMARGTLKRNTYYGARFPESFASDEAWLAINRYAGRQLLYSSAALAVLGVVILFLPLQAHPAAALLIQLVLGILVLVPCLASWRFARRYGKSQSAPPDSF